MAAAVCRKRSYFEDESSSKAAYKRFRRCSSPVRPSPVDQLKAMFPESGDNLFYTAATNARKEFQVPRSDDPVDLIVEEMKMATSIDDAKSRAARVLDRLAETTRAQQQAAGHKEDVMLREQVEALLRDNAILQRAVAFQHQRQKEFEDKKAQEQKQLEARFLEQYQTLEMNNYALTLQLRLAQQPNLAIHDGRFNPDVF